MGYKLYKLKMTTTHFGGGLLETATPIMPVERLYSALYLEALKMGEADAFFQLSNSEHFGLSDLFLFKDELFLPKPIGYPKKVTQTENVGDRTQAKLAKKIQYIPVSVFKEFLNGEITDLSELAQRQSGLFTHSSVTKKGEDPFRVASIHYHDDVYIAFIASDSELVEALVASLQFSGIGGKRSVGFGQFQYEVVAVPQEVEPYITTQSEQPVMLLNSAMALDSELDEVVANANYLLMRSGGFAYSYESSDNFRKQDYYKFKAGSTFDKGFDGEIVDVAPESFPHPVWQYAKPLFIEIGGFLHEKNI